jgi:Ca-activated chloride channel family protein
MPPCYLRVAAGPGGGLRTAHDADYLTIVPAGAPDGDYGPYTYTADGSPLTLDVPGDPGAYEIRYQSDRTEIGVLARKPLTVQ